jgi:hypothetical protein
MGILQDLRNNHVYIAKSLNDLLDSGPKGESIFYFTTPESLQYCSLGIEGSFLIPIHLLSNPFTPYGLTTASIVILYVVNFYQSILYMSHL